MAIPFGLGPITFMTLSVIAITLLITVVQKMTVDQNVMRELKADSKKMRKEVKALRNDPEKFQQHQKKMMELSMKQMKMSFKPMMYYMIPLLLFFTWLRNTMTDVIVLRPPVWPWEMGWLGTYILLSIFFSMIFRKILKVN
ncbi:MAG: EMC3/TMCO1 family protein [Candidatus Nanoarchaeia archaeon]|jgi:uncharacterized membrane protein (DUF106 family)|nr:EMC3/TMCO1 family protein [Candidatus Nanoarchaeia archaeon]|tara:strand:+ start:10918 stop:11340 length:423 start_codon:yes stop_codon:yes gene_type:complete